MEGVPAGFMANRYGHLVPERLVRPEIKLEDQVVREVVLGAERLRERVAQFKKQCFDEVRAFLALIDEKYGVKRAAGSRGGTQLESFDGTLRVTISVADIVALGPEISSAKALIDECITRWSEGANGNLKAVVDDAFALGEGGKLAIDRVLGLRRIAIEDPAWERAMEAIADAVRVMRSREYLRIYRRESPELPFQQLVLDFARL
ncbi:MAG: DUF3164 family protein [Rhodospirillales bacterium]|nr:DUF3164 family protein [Rhodospirillales bacterium]